MTQSPLFAPMGVLAGITFFVLLFVPARRMFGGRSEVQNSATGDIPGGTHNPNFADLLEMPVLFYIVCLMTVLAGRTDDTMLWLAWIYVALRAAHSAVHLTYDKRSQPDRAVRAVEFRGAGDVGVLLHPAARELIRTGVS